MGESENPHFYDFWIFGRVPEFQNQQSLSLETPRLLNEIKKIPGTFSKCYLYKSQNAGHPEF